MPESECTPVPDPAAGLLRQIGALSEEIKRTQQRLAQQLRDQPDNPDLRRIGPRCCMLPAHCLDRQLTLDPFRYDWQAQLARLATHLEAITAHPARTGRLLADLLAGQAENTRGRTYRYAPEVMSAARPILTSALAIIAALQRLQAGGMTATGASSGSL